MPALQLDKLSRRVGAVRQSGGGGREDLLGSLTKGRPIRATSTPALPSLKEVLRVSVQWFGGGGGGDVLGASSWSCSASAPAAGTERGAEGDKLAPKCRGFPWSTVCFPDCLYSLKPLPADPRSSVGFCIPQVQDTSTARLPVALGTGVGCSSSQLKVKEIPINPLKAGSAKGNICPCF